MRKNNLALYIAIGLAGLAIISLRTGINQQITTSLSIATLLFTIAQTVESKENYMDYARRHHITELEFIS